MVYFASYYVDGYEAMQIHMFHNLEDLFKWIQLVHDETDAMPKKLWVFKAECLLDAG